MPSALLLTALLMGLAGGPHCAAMCGAACSGLARDSRELIAFQAGRILGYGTLGGLAAGSFQALGWLSAASAAARPLWTLFHMALLMLGLTLLWQARQPAWMEGLARSAWDRACAFVRAVSPVAATASASVATPQAMFWSTAGPSAPSGLAGAPHRPLSRPGARFAAGMAWALMPCGLLYSALLVAILAGSAAGGAAAMAVFASGSAVSLALGPWLWRRFSRRLPRTWAARVAGALLVGLSAWALWMGDMAHTLPWCASP